MNCQAFVLYWDSNHRHNIISSKQELEPQTQMMARTLRWVINEWPLLHVQSDPSPRPCSTNDKSVQCHNRKLRNVVKSMKLRGRSSYVTSQAFQ